MEFSKIVVLAIAAVVCLVVASEAITCRPDYCNSVRCPQVYCRDNQILKKQGGFCGCCDVCVTQLDVGESCMIIRGMPPTAECKKGLQCLNRRCMRPPVVRPPVY